MLSKNRNTQSRLLISLPPQARQGRKIYLIVSNPSALRQTNTVENGSPMTGIPLSYEITILNYR